MQNSLPDHDVEKLLVGNKCDLESKRVIPYRRGEEVRYHCRCFIIKSYKLCCMELQMAKQYNIKYIETSARTNHNITEVGYPL